MMLTPERSSRILWAMAYGLVIPLVAGLVLFVLGGFAP
jgi:hypothetical protein